MLNPFRVLVIVAAVIAIVLFAGFIAVAFFHVGGHPQSIGSIATVTGVI